jgi:hypothetical protein
VEPETFGDPGCVQPLEHGECVVEVEQIKALVVLKRPGGAKYEAGFTI